MTSAVAVILPRQRGFGPGHRMVAALADLPGRFRAVVLGPPGAGAFGGLEYRDVAPPWRPGRAARRYAGAVERMVHSLDPAVIEVHDDVEVAARLGAAFRPVPVVLILHTDPQAQQGARDAAARTYLLAQVTRVGAMSAALRSRALQGVHPAMRVCAVLPSLDGPGGPAALADALDALRVDALEAWSRALGGPI